MTIEAIKNIVTIDRSKAFIPHPLITKEFGEMSVKWQHPLAEKIITFNLEEDVIFKTFEEDDYVISIEDTYNRMQFDHIPLDIYCLQAIWENKKLVETLKDMWWKGLGTPKLRTLNFLGTLFTDDGFFKPCLHIMCIEYTMLDPYRPKIMPYEIYDAGWGNGDPILFFNPRSTLVKNLL